MKKQKGLVIAEKPSLMRELEKAYKKSSLNAELKFVTLAGHVYMTVLPDEMDEKYKKWKKEDLPIMPSNLIYKSNPKTYSLLKAVKDALKNDDFDFVVNGCDAGREGESIFFEVYKNLKMKMPIKRIWASDVTEGVLIKAIENMLDYKDELFLQNLMKSSFLRQEFDWLLGMNLSRAATLANNSKVPIGRVMTPTLRLIVERENEIKNFKSNHYYEIESLYKIGIKGTYEKDSEKGIEKKEVAEKIYKEVKDAKKGKIVEISSKNNISNPPTLHSLLELQKEANSTLSFTAAKTLEVAQSLYEKHKLITYPRTSSRVLPRSMEKDLFKSISAFKNHDLSHHLAKVTKEDVESLMKNKNYVDDTKVTDHHAITITTTPYQKGRLSKDEENLYDLIVKRLISLFLGPEKSIMTDIEVDINSYIFKTKNKEVIDAGYKKLYPSKEQSIKINLKKFDEIDISKINLLAKETKPPKRYTDSSLLGTMANPTKEITEDDLKKVLKESEGLGTDATRSSILENLIKYKMVKREKKVFFALDYGMEIIKIMKDSEVASPITTARWEKKLREIEDGKFDPKVFKSEMRTFIEDETKKTLSLKGNFTKESSEKVGTCPKCSSDVLDKNYYICEKYKNGCDFILSKKILSKTIPKSEITKLLNGKETKKMKFKNKDSKEFEASLVLKNGKTEFVFDERKNEQKEKTETSNEKICTCVCKGEIIDKGNFYGCSKCSLTISKEILKGKISKKDVQKLIKEGKTDKKDFVSTKTGKKFSAFLVLKNEKTEFSFE